MNKIKNIVCNKLNDSLINENEIFINKKLKEGWDILIIQDCMIVALNNVLKEFNYN